MVIWTILLCDEVFIHLLTFIQQENLIETNNLFSKSVKIQTNNKTQKYSILTIKWSSDYK